MDRSIDKLLNIPSVDNGASFDGCDHMGICLLFWREHGLDIPFLPNGLGQNIQQIDKFLRNFTVEYDIRFSKKQSVIEPQYGDLVYVYYGHWGVCIDKNTFLTYGYSAKSRLYDLQKSVEQGNLFSIFRPKQQIEPKYRLTGTEDIYYLPVI